MVLRNISFLCVSGAYNIQSRIFFREKIVYELRDTQSDNGGFGPATGPR
ncbi:MAG: hypothetical protein AB1611_08960 [bacterium]